MKARRALAVLPEHLARRVFADQGCNHPAVRQLLGERYDGLVLRWQLLDELPHRLILLLRELGRGGAFGVFGLSQFMSARENLDSTFGLRLGGPRL